jgi:PKD repeat protein
MNLRSALLGLLPALAVLVGACSQGNSGDGATTTSTGAVAVPTGIDRFLLFPNPVQSGSAFETNTTDYAEAYYRAVDAAGQRTTLTAFKAVNGFDSGTGTQHTVVFRDVQDLGYGRRMTGRLNTDGSVAFIVENYDVSVVPGTYSSLNVDAAVARDQRWHVGVNAIEYSATPCDSAKDPAACDPNVKFAKFYNYSPTTGARQLTVDLDGKGAKAMPGPCVSCHGGRGDPLTPVDGASQTRFAEAGNSASRKRGDTQARLQPFRIDTFGFATTANWTRADQESKLKDFNKWVLCTYPLPSGTSTPTGNPEDVCAGTSRRVATAGEWQGTAAEMIKSWYGGAGMGNAAYDDTYVPSGWSGNPTLYRTVLVPYCRTCHIVRGTGAQSDIDLHTLAKFQSYAARIRTHVFDRGNMPLAALVYEDFWRDNSAVQTLANYLDSVLGAQTATDSAGAPLRPGRPIADPGPDRVVRAGADARLSGTDSLFATSYLWTVVTQPGGGDATITNATSATATFRATVTGTYTVRLAVNGGGSADRARTISIEVSSTFPDPASLRFLNVKDLLQTVTHSAGQTCQSCHAASGSPVPPVFYNAFDRDNSGTVTATDDDWLYKEVAGRVNLTEVTASPLLRKPTGNHHNGSNVLDLSTLAGRENYSKLYHWILAGMPAGGVAANAGADSTNTVTFSAGPTASVSLNGSASLGSITSYAWTVLSQPTGGNATIASPSSASTTMSFARVGAYTVQLAVSDGTVTSTDTRVITIAETAVTTSFTPGDGTTPLVTFSGGVGDITLTPTNVGSPATCTWAKLSGPGTLSATNTCSAVTLNVAFANVGASVQIQFTVNGLADPANTSSATNTFTIGSAAAASAAAIATGASQTVSFTNPSVPSTAGIPAGTVSLDSTGSSSGGGVTYTWAITSQPGTATGSYLGALSSTSAANPTLTVHRAGSYDLQLTVDNGTGPAVATKTITVAVPVASRSFAAVKAVVTSPAACNACHDLGSTAFVPLGGGQPSFTDINDLSGNSLYTRVAARADLTNPATSLLVDCPANGCRTMGSGHAGFGGGDFSNYNLFLNWIIGGTPP